MDVALGVDRRDVARREVALRVELSAALTLEIPAGDPGTANERLSERLAVPGQRTTIVVNDLEIDTPDSVALFEFELQLLLRRQRGVFCLQPTDDT